MKGRGRSASGSPSFEGLESRVLLSGNVTAYAAAGNLYVFGDSAANDVVVTRLAGNQFSVASGSTTTTQINGAAGPATIDNVTGSVWAFMNDGDDLLRVAASPGDVWYFGGPGNNSLTVDTGSIGNLWCFNSIGNDNITVSHNSTGSIFVDQGTGHNNLTLDTVNVTGNVTCLSPAGTNELMLGSSNISGNIFSSMGYGTSVVGLVSTTVNGSLFVSNTGGGDLGGSAAGFSTDTEFLGSTVTGPTTILNLLGSDKINCISATFGSVFVSNGPGAGAFVGTTTSFNGSVLFLGGLGGSLPSAPGYASGFVATNGHLSGSLTALNGLGTDQVYLMNYHVTGDVTVLDGPGGTDTWIQGVVDGNVLVIGGGDTPVPSSTASGAFRATANAGSGGIGGTTTLLLGAGAGAVVGGDFNFAGNVYINGSAALVASFDTCAFQHDLTVFRGDGGALPAPYSSDSGLFLITGCTFNGKTAITTGTGTDAVTIDDSSFVGACDITTGPDYAAAADVDVVNIDRAGSTSAVTTFTGPLTLKTGADNDLVYIGNNTSGSPDANARAHIIADAHLDGGPGSDTLEYLDTRNILDGLVFTNVFETVT